MDVYYYRGQYEIDFVICEGNRVDELIQVSLDISTSKTYNREVSALLRGAKDLKCGKLTLITIGEDRNIVEKDHTINIVSALDWLLNIQE